MIMVKKLKKVQNAGPVPLVTGNTASITLCASSSPYRAELLHLPHLEHSYHRHNSFLKASPSVFNVSVGKLVTLPIQLA
jgi:hypothetical protein